MATVAPISSPYDIDEDSDVVDEFDSDAEVEKDRTDRAATTDDEDDDDDDDGELVTVVVVVVVVVSCGIRR